MSMKRYTKWIVSALGAGLLAVAVPAWADSSKKGNDKEAYALMRGNEAFNNGEVLDARDWYQKEVNENPENGYRCSAVWAVSRSTTPTNESK